ncbi:MAG: hypothetical protein WAV85_11005 [Rhodoferax sp.]
MATSSKRVADPVVKPQTVKPRAVKTPKPKDKDKALPFLRFYHSEVLRTKTHTVLTALEEDPDPTQHRNALGDLVAELSDAGLNYFFMGPLRLAKPGFLVEQSASLGMAGARQVLGSVARNIIGRMDKPQLLSVSASIRQLTQ